MMRLSSELRGLRYGPAEEAGLTQPGTGTDPNAAGEQGARPALAITGGSGARLSTTIPCERIRVSSMFLRLVTLRVTRKAKTRLKVSKHGICYGPFCRL